MKKVYKKPTIFVESFQLNAAIAGSCSDEVGEMPINHYADSCGFRKSEDPFFEYEFFAEFNCANDMTIGGGDGNDEHCYHGPLNESGFTFVWS